MTQIGGRAIALGADISDRGQMVAAVHQLKRAFGPVTILVNNAGMTGFAPFLELTDDQWDVTQVVIPDMIAAGWGRNINISSSSAQSGAANMAHYSSSKAGMIALTRWYHQPGLPCRRARHVDPRLRDHLIGKARASCEVGGWRPRNN